MGLLLGERQIGCIKRVKFHTVFWRTLNGSKTLIRSGATTCGKSKAGPFSIGLDDSLHPIGSVKKLVTVDRVGTFAKEVHGKIE